MVGQAQGLRCPGAIARRGSGKHFAEISRHRSYSHGMARPLSGRRRDWNQEPRGGRRRRGATAAQVRGRQRERRKRAIAREDRPPGERPPFGVLEVETNVRRKPSRIRVCENRNPIKPRLCSPFHGKERPPPAWQREET